MHRDTKGNGGHDGELVAGVVAFHVKGRVGFGVAQCLRFFQHVGKVGTLLAHFAEDEVGRAVDDAGQPFDTVGRQAFAQRLDDGDAASYSRFERHHHAFFLRAGKNFVAVYRQQLFVGGNHVLAVGNSLQYQLFGHGVATDQLYHDVHIGVVDHGKRIGHHGDVGADQLTGLLYIAAGSNSQADVAAGTAADFFRVTLQYGGDTATDCSHPHQANIDRLHC